MNKNFFRLILSTIFLLPIVAQAQPEPYAPVVNVPQISSLQQLIHSLENAAGLVFGAIAVIMFIMAGVLFLTAQGAPEKVQQARQAFLWGVAGVIVGILAFSIILCL